MIKNNKLKAENIFLKLNFCIFLVCLGFSFKTIATNKAERAEKTIEYYKNKAI